MTGFVKNYQQAYKKLPLPQNMTKIDICNA